jgi:hypothetical protein
MNATERVTSLSAGLLDRYRTVLMSRVWPRMPLLKRQDGYDVDQEPSCRDYPYMTFCGISHRFTSDWGELLEPGRLADKDRGLWTLRRKYESPPGYYSDD